MRGTISHDKILLWGVISASIVEKKNGFKRRSRRAASEGIKYEMMVKMQHRLSEIVWVECRLRWLIGMALTQPSMLMPKQSAPQAGSDIATKPKFKNPPDCQIEGCTNSATHYLIDYKINICSCHFIDRAEAAAPQAGKDKG